jgi:RNA polymerase sigma-70 factor (ECF subfamily)
MGTTTRGVGQAEGAGMERQEGPLPAPVGGFDAFYAAEHRSIVGVVMMLTGDRAVADDIVQEAFAAAYRRWSTVSGYDRPGAWVRRVAVNQAISARRRRRAEARALRRVGTDERAGAAPEVPNEALWAAVRRLPKRQAQAVALTYGEDLGLAEVAGILGCSVGSVKTHLSRARARLAEELQDQRPPLVTRPDLDGGAAHV